MTRRSIVAAAALLCLGFHPQAGLAQEGEAYRAPRAADGRPDLNGIWQALNSANWNIEDHAASPGIPAGFGIVQGGTLPYLPSALAQRQRNFENRATEDPEAKCYQVGVPRIMYMPYPLQIVQTPGQVTILSEYAHTQRNIYIDREHVPEGIQWYMGDSRGRWEGETLVVDVARFTDETWFDRAGNYHSEALHVVERITRTGPDHLLYEATIEDPNVFSRPWTMSMPLYRRQETDARLLEYECYAFLERWENR
jgi:hypothetical protein